MISLGDPTEISQEDIEGGLLDSCLKAISSKRRFQLSETVTILCYGHDLSEDDGHSIPRLDAVKTALKQSNIPFAPLEICKGNVEFKHWDSAIIDSPDDWNEFQGERRYQVSDLVNQA